MSEIIDFSSHANFDNRELSWLLFNKRVLSEAKDKQNPLFERLKFLSITASNLDEFFMIRVAALKDLVGMDYDKTDIAGMTPQEQLKEIYRATHDLVGQQYSTYNRSLLPQLRLKGLRVIERHEDLTDAEAKHVDNYFEENVYPVLTPMAVDSSRPFPLIRNKSLNIGALVRNKKAEGELEFATVQVPSVLSRIVVLPYEAGGKAVILLEEIIERNIDKLFLNYDIVCAHHFRIMRNADLNIEEDETDDLLKEIEKQLKKRQWGQAIRLEAEESMDGRLLQIIREELSIREEDIYAIDGPLDLTFLMKMYGMEGFDHLKENGYAKPMPVPGLLGPVDIFAEIRKRDILLFHPFQEFKPVLELIEQAADDPEVLAIKQTLYRVGGNSPIIAALAQAAENGKQVTVLVELKARFDEEKNIVWAKMLEKAGCHVIYGLVGLKTHCKITLIVRREEEGIRRYVHLGTGNYNDVTARQYTDLGLLTCGAAMGEDATAVFNMLSGYSEPLLWNKLTLAPLWLKERFLYLIDRERRNARNNRPAHLIAKINSLCDKEIIEALYKAATAGVQVDLIVRGICCLKVGLAGMEGRITVRSIIGNFLEHSRLFYFENDGSPEYYCSSADWMPRNLERRVEILYPVEQAALREQMTYIFDTLLADNVKAHCLTPEGAYEKIDKRGKTIVNSQQEFCRWAARISEQGEEMEGTRV
ncbi:MAG: RNA degradosome polyphosphate kinase, partial [Lachnospiraceae bacterium]|nr:RNA degradosome polyphosphate kinase [Lachnospiraceae bacterium]